MTANFFHFLLHLGHKIEEYLVLSIQQENHALMLTKILN